MSNPSNPPKQRGCFFYGCLTLAVLGLVLVIMVGAGLYFAKRASERLINEFTDTTPTLLETVEYSPEQMNALQARLTAFKEALDKGDLQRELILSADDLNALIAKNKDLKGKLFVMIDDDRIKGNISMPLQDIGPLKLKGRYLNGTAAFAVELENGSLDVKLEDVQVKGKPLPPIIMSELKKQNLAEKVLQDPRTAADIAKFESIRIKDGKVILKNRARTEIERSKP